MNSQQEINDMVERHRQFSWREGFVDGILVGAVAVITAAAIFIFLLK